MPPGYVRRSRLFILGVHTKSRLKIELITLEVDDKRGQPISFLLDIRSDEHTRFVSLQIL